MLKGKKVLLGVTASIAAYKATYIVRLLKKLGASVRVIQTEASLDFVTPLVLSTLSENSVIIDVIDKDTKEWNSHVELGLWADYIIFAPLTAKSMSKMVEGNCDNQLIASYLSAKCPVYFAPAMDLDMYIHPSTKENLVTLKSFGNTIIPATSGELASGLVGEGRMAEPADIVSFIEKDILSSLPLKGKKLLLTAGPTYEAIDPVRFIGNHSSGKMGFAIAEAAANLGAEVYLISGPSHQQTKNALIKKIDVVSAEEMYEAAHAYFKQVDIAILSAAVADYKPKNIVTQKIKKKDATLNIELIPTKDILASLGEIKQQQFLVGFALETDNELENAKSKLKRKNLDAIVLNSLQDEGAGFATDTNKITIIDKNLKEKSFKLKSKLAVAKDIMNEIVISIRDQE